MFKWQFLTKDQNDDLTENWVQDQGDFLPHFRLNYTLDNHK